MPDDTRDALLEAARTRFLRFGPRKTTMEEVAREAGCARATIYLHFKSKVDLYAALLERETDAFVRDAEALLEQELSPYEKFRRLGRIWVDAYKTNPILRLALGHDPEMTIDLVASAAIRRQHRRMIEVMGRGFAEGRRKGLLRDVDPESRT